MIRLLKQLISSEKGQALPIVLALLVLGGLMIAPSLNYAATTLNHSQIIDKGLNGVYAAEAGVENALWYLTDNTSPPAQLTENINRMEVAIETEDKGAYTLYFGEMVVGESHSQDIGVDGEMVWESGDTYEYTITATWQAGPGCPPIWLIGVGARLPVGYSYQDGSAALFGSNLSTAEPDEVIDTFGAYMLSWEFETPRPEVSEGDPVATQIFYVTGEGELEGNYVWAVASSSDIGEVGELIGNLYIITATATRLQDGEIAARIVADVLVEEGAVNIISWQISK